MHEKRDDLNGNSITRRLGEIRDDRTDWKRVDALTEEALAQAIQDDPDTFEPDPSCSTRL